AQEVTGNVYSQEDKAQLAFNHYSNLLGTSPAPGPDGFIGVPTLFLKLDIAKAFDSQLFKTLGSRRFSRGLIRATVSTGRWMVMESGTEHLLHIHGQNLIMIIHVVSSTSVFMVYRKCLQLGSGKRVAVEDFCLTRFTASAPWLKKKGRLFCTQYQSSRLSGYTGYSFFLYLISFEVPIQKNTEFRSIIAIELDDTFGINVPFFQTSFLIAYHHFHILNFPFGTLCLQLFMMLTIFKILGHLHYSIKYFRKCGFWRGPDCGPGRFLPSHGLCREQYLLTCSDDPGDENLHLQTNGPYASFRSNIFFYSLRAYSIIIYTAVCMYLHIYEQTTTGKYRK
ncbi:hypothetical protein ACJX0J_017191, partial [Zea mays]